MKLVFKRFLPSHVEFTGFRRSPDVLRTFFLVICSGRGRKGQNGHSFQEIKTAEAAKNKRSRFVNDSGFSCPRKTSVCERPMGPASIPPINSNDGKTTNKTRDFLTIPENFFVSGFWSRRPKDRGQDTMHAVLLSACATLADCMSLTPTSLIRPKRQKFFLLFALRFPWVQPKSAQLRSAL